MKWEKHKDYYAYFKKIKINNQTIEVFMCYNDLKPKNRFSVYASVYSKRKNADSDYQERKGTGKSGVLTLLKIREAILDFEQFYKEIYDKDFEVLVFWTDKKRRDVYDYGLKNYGYKFNIRCGKKCLVKKIKNQKLLEVQG